jgi:predicted nucleic acid binding AN1-type Zn finger protein
MVRCKYYNCNNKILKLIGKCKSCDNIFCSQHRYTETHNCVKLLEFKISKKEILVSKLLNESVSSNKLNKI